ncbi:MULTISPECIES: hypothetical protein [Streptomyces]|uniref:hypothetical protein n=1 Tax=Streptomyces TaxID=1883 RepID=UPI000B1AD1A3|nr:MULTISPECIES: hypothetical protein [Streptomyces]RPK93336.1 hypothetical protein EES46_06215 [Streptomyces sp. ADI98-10]
MNARLDAFAGPVAGELVKHLVPANGRSRRSCRPGHQVGQLGQEAHGRPSAVHG